MFIGHFGLAFAAKRAAPRVSLGTRFAAAQFADLLWPTLVLLGIEVVRAPARPAVDAVRIGAVRPRDVELAAGLARHRAHDIRRRRCGVSWRDAVARSRRIDRDRGTRRLAQAIARIAEGKSQNWKYERPRKRA